MTWYILNNERFLASMFLNVSASNKNRRMNFTMGAAVTLLASMTSEMSLQSTRIGKWLCTIRATEKFSYQYCVHFTGAKHPECLRIIREKIIFCKNGGEITNPT